jgi:hypothetical protein
MLNPVSPVIKFLYPGLSLFSVPDRHSVIKTKITVMKEFLMLFRNENPAGGEMPSAEQMQAVMKDWQDWIASVAAAGKFLSTNRLYSEGKSLSADGRITDGPYAEVKEMIGGYLIVKAADLEEATEMAKACPNLKYGGKVEVRRVMPMDGDVNSTDFLQEK